MQEDRLICRRFIRQNNPDQPRTHIDSCRSPQFLRADCQIPKGGVLEGLSDLFVRRGVPDHIRSDSFCRLVVSPSSYKKGRWLHETHQDHIRSNRSGSRVKGRLFFLPFGHHHVRRQVLSDLAFMRVRLIPQAAKLCRLHPLGKFSQIADRFARADSGQGRHAEYDRIIGSSQYSSLTSQQCRLGDTGH